MTESSPPIGSPPPRSSGPNDVPAPEPPPPNVAISYSWDDEEHKTWVKTELAARLWSNGVRASLDAWLVGPGHSLTQFMEGLVRENQFVLAVCTPVYKTRADGRVGGVGYETELMASALLERADPRRFVAILRRGDRESAVPEWLKGRIDIDLRGQPGEQQYEEQFRDLLRTLHDYQEQPPLLGPRPFPPGPNVAASPAHRPVGFSAPVSPATGSAAAAGGTAAAADEGVRIIGLSTDELRGASAEGADGSTPIMLAVRLSKAPSTNWAALFADAWDHLRDAPRGHRPGMARVEGDRIVLTGMTPRELRDVHRASLDAIVNQVNEAMVRMGSR